MKHITIIWLLLGCIYTSFAQTITIKQKGTELPLELVTLMSEHPKAFTVTNAKGQADISAFKEANQIDIRLLGFETKSLSYTQLDSLGFELSLSPSAINMNEIVFSGTKWNQNSSDVPSKIVSVSAKTVALQNPQTAADLLGVSGKVFIQKSQQGGGSPMIRGFATNRLLYMVDGVRMNTAIFRGGNIQNVISLDPFAIENTEVLFGAGSTIYGSDAIGGVMSFNTLTPQLSLNDKMLVNGKAVVRHSTANNEKTGHLDFNLGWKKIAFVTSISVFDYDDLKQGSNGPDDYIKDYHVERINGIDSVVQQKDPLLQVPTAYSQLNIMEKIRFKPSDKLDIQYGFHYSTTSSYGRYDRHNRLRNGFPRYAQWDYGPQKWMMNNLNITHVQKTALYDQMVIRIAYQNFEESRIDRSINKNDKTIQTEKVNASSINVDFNRSISEKNTLYYGVEGVLDQINSTGEIIDISTSVSKEGPSRYPKSTWSSAAIYLNDKYKASENFTVQAGLRYNQCTINAKFDTTYYPFSFTSANINNGAVTGSLGGIFKPTKNLVTFVNFGTAFRSPNVDDMGKVFDSEPGVVTVPNPDLKAEYAYNFDLGATKVFNNFLKVDITGYYTLLKNALVRRDFILDGKDSIMYDGALSQVQAIQNAAKAYVYGVQAGIEVKLPANLSFTSDFNYQKGKEELDNGTISPSRHAAPWFGVSKLSYKTQKFTIQLYSNYQGTQTANNLAEEEKGKTEIYAKDANGNNYSPGWYTINIKMMYDINKFFSVNGGIENITNQRYRPYSSGMSGAGRNFIASIKATF